MQDGDNFIVKRKKIVRVPMLSELDALVELRNKYLLQKMEYKLLKTIQENEYMDNKTEGTLTPYIQERLEKEIDESTTKIKAFANSIDVVEDLIQAELDKKKGELVN